MDVYDRYMHDTCPVCCGGGDTNACNYFRMHSFAFKPRQAYVKECCIERECIRIQGGHDMYNHSAMGVGHWHSLQCDSTDWNQPKKTDCLAVVSPVTSQSSVHVGGAEK